MLQIVFISLISKTYDITKIQSSMTAAADDEQQSYRSCYTRLDNISQLKITKHVITNKCLLSPVTGNCPSKIQGILVYHETYMSSNYFKSVKKNWKIDLNDSLPCLAKATGLAGAVSRMRREERLCVTASVTGKRTMIG